MAQIDLVLKGGTVVTPDGTVRADVEIDGGRIVGISAGGLPVRARETIDVAGLVLLPGLIDTHTHLAGDFTESVDLSTLYDVPLKDTIAVASAASITASSMCSDSRSRTVTRWPSRRRSACCR